MALRAIYEAGEEVVKISPVMGQAMAEQRALTIAQVSASSRKAWRQKEDKRE